MPIDCIDSRRQLSQSVARLAVRLGCQSQNAWQYAALSDLVGDPADTDSRRIESYRMPASALYGMPMVGLVPVAVRRLPVANATGMPMPRSADC